MIKLERVEAALRKVYQYAEPNLTLVGWMGFIGYPVYYIIWAYAFPQPYENLPLRIFCSFLFFGLIFRNKPKPKWRRYFYLYYQVVITFALPFFFFYMLLMNDWSLVWVMSFMAASFLHILLVHITTIMFAETLLGISVAIFFAWISQGFYLNLSVDWVYIPIFLFIYLFGNTFYVRNLFEHEENISVAKAFGAGIAHEMRNPLSALYSSIDIIQSIIPNPNEEKKETYQLSKNDIILLQDVLNNAMASISSGSETIDLLLTSIDENRVSRLTFKRHRVQDVVKHAIESFSYKNSVDKLAITIDYRGEFEFLGSDTLLKYLLYNLFKNAYRYRTSDEFNIHVIIEVEDEKNKIIVEDNGPGIAPEIIDDIFQEFYTTAKSGNYGLGLPFCRKVMAAFCGNIECESALGRGSRFILTFPFIHSKASNTIRHELTCLKSILLVTDNAILVSHMANLNRVMGFRLNLMNIQTTLKKEEYEFEYDLIFIDLESTDPTRNDLDRLEAIFGFTTARIVYLFQDHPIQRQTNLSFLPIWIEIQTWFLNTGSKIDSLLFGAQNIVVNIEEQKSLDEQKRRIIMVVEDSKSLRILTSMMLEKLGFEVIQCENGLKALELLETEHVDLILLDIEMPIMNGLDVSVRIRKSEKYYSNLPIIAHTGDSSPATLDKINLAGISGYIIKPVDKKRLFEKITHWI